MLFQNTLYSGTILLLIGFFTGVGAIKSKREKNFTSTFLFVGLILSLIIIIYTMFLQYSRNIIIISTSFYALNFLIQISENQYRKKRKIETVKTIKKTSSVKQAIKELKKEIQKTKAKETYYYTETGKTFHKAGCIALSRTKKENIKTNNSRDNIIALGYKTCKVCNS